MKGHKMHLEIQDLSQFTGTQYWYKNSLFPGYTYTDGVKYVATQANAYWLMDAILSHQLIPKVKRELFQQWTLTLTENSAAVLVCDDGNDNVVMQIHIAFTDFPLSEIKMYLTNKVLLLPSEY
ncbi:MAG: hypothetical protein F6K00_29920 [Leptolyngbya sp. SIOISBB]|nr:hypothetical protein [Leptolyngbya sp. SIOISBB]